MRKETPYRFALAALLTAAACAKEQEVELPDAPPPDKGVQYRMVTTVAPGLEIERCQFFVVPPGGLHINHDEVRYTPGSHHVLLYKTDYTSIPTRDVRGQIHDTSAVFDCEEGATADWQVTGVIAGAQAAKGEPMVNLPEGVAIHVPGGTVVLMNTHYLNASGSPLDVDARINVYTLKPEEVKQEGGLLFFYNPFIYLPPGQSGTARMRCPLGKDITLANVQSHMHRRGVGYEADWIDGTGREAKVLQRLYENTHWEEVPVKLFSPGKALRAGTALDYSCHYRNDENRAVIQGAKTSDEMCMLIGSYYPRDVPLEICAGATFMGTGKTGCGPTALCAAGAKAEADFYACVVDSCPQVASEMTAALRCQFSRGNGACQKTCTDEPAMCQACVQQACKDSLDACLQARC